ncbi:SpoIIE family protein phosphatase [Streptomyces sp. Tue6028]|uniref:SpoIIE family protein phosphatase n=1 Tax=Streptomyces sp. Tue6028 TaxID=2036037 RepID=UPI003D722503
MEGLTTALTAQVPPDEPVVQLVNRGHPPPPVLHQGLVHALVPACSPPPFGLHHLITDSPVKPESHPFLPGDRLLLYTDGVIETRSRDNSFLALPDAMEGMGDGPLLTTRGYRPMVGILIVGTGGVFRCTTYSAPHDGHRYSLPLPCTG